MPTTDVLELRCRCGEVRGRATNVSPRTVNRVVCYCDDCQAFAHHLGRADLLDAHGGSDIVQIAAATLAFTQGESRIACLRLSPKGLYRWYATCCNTPVGNTVTPAVPFIGVMASSFERVDEVAGPPVGAILGKFAVGEPPPGSTRLHPRLLARVVRLLLTWKLGGKSWPHPFFDRATGAPRFPVTVITREQRDALRAQCGPRPAAA